MWRSKGKRLTSTAIFQRRGVGRPVIGVAKVLCWQRKTDVLHAVRVSQIVAYVLTMYAHGMT
jgi:hypothetical protein